MSELDLRGGTRVLVSELAVVLHSLLELAHMLMAEGEKVHELMTGDWLADAISELLSVLDFLLSEYGAEDVKALALESIWALVPLHNSL